MTRYTRYTARNKYRNKKVEVQGVKYDSKKEAKITQEILLLEKAGKVRDVVLKPKFDFKIEGETIRYASGRPLTYTADVQYFDIEKDKLIVVDIKGFETDVFKIKRALMKHINLIDIEIL